MGMINKAWLLDLVYRAGDSPQSALPQPKATRGQAWAVGSTCCVLFTLLYGFSVAPSLGMGHDTGELTTCCVVQGVPHSPGYPLFVAIGWLASQLLPANPAYAINLLSALELGLGLGFLGAGLALATGPGPALLATLMTGTCTAVWRQAVVTEVFALHLFFLCLLSWLAILWRYAEDTRRRELVLVTSFILGCCLAHQHITAVAGPAFLFFGATAKGKGRAWGFSWLNLPVLLAGVALPYALQCYMARQDPPLNWADVENFSRLKDHFLRKAYGTGLLNAAALQWDSRAGDGQVTAFFLSLVRSYFPFPSFLLLLLAVDRTFRSRFDPNFWLYFLIFFFYGPWFALIGNQPGDEFYSDMMERFYSSAMIGAAGMTALGIEWLLELAGPQRRRLAPVLLCLPLFNGFLNYPKCSQRGQYHSIDTFRAMLHSLPPRSAVIVGGDLPAGAADFLRYVQGERLDVVVILPGLAAAPWYLERVPVGLARAAVKSATPDQPVTHDVALKNMVEYFEKRGMSIWINELSDKLEGQFIKVGLLYRYFPAKGATWTDAERREQYRQALESLEKFPRRGDFRQDWRQNFWMRYCIDEWLDAFRELARGLKDTDPDLACRALDQIIEMENPSNLESHLNRGDLRLALNRFEEAIRDYKLALRLAPGNRLALEGLVVAYRKLGRNDEANLYQGKLQEVLSNQ